MEGIQVSTEIAGRNNQISIIRVGGYIDTTTSSEVERALMSLLRRGRYKIIIDLGNVDYISSAGWGIFISEIKSIRENRGDLKLVRMIPDVYEIFELLEFHHILDVYDSVEEAVQKFEMEYAGVPTATPADQMTEKEPLSVEMDSMPGGSLLSTEEEEASDMELSDAESATRDEPAKEKFIRLSQLPLEEKIKYIVAKNPEIGAFKINKYLNSPEFGFTRVGWFNVRSILNKLGLNSRKNRREFAEEFRKEHNMA